MPEVRGVQDHPGRQRRRGEGSVRSLALLKGAAGHDLRSAEIIVVAGNISVIQTARVSSPAVEAVLLFALRYQLLPRPEICIPRERYWRRLCRQVQLYHAQKHPLLFNNIAMIIARV